VAGNLALGEKFQKLAATLTDFSKISKIKTRRGELYELQTFPDKSGRRGTPPSEKKKTAVLPAGITPDWKKQIHQMRMRIQKERTPHGRDDLAIKTGKGGLMDAEFIAQALCLENGWQEANTLRALERARDAVGVQSLDCVAAKGTLKRELQPLTRGDFEKLLENYRRLRRVEGILRRWSYEGETVLPDDAAAFYRVSVRSGFSTPEEFGKSLAKWRKAVREVYEKVFNAEEKNIKKSCG
jgi:glutamate-ammonia-ligase adenylyltransferase